MRNEISAAAAHSAASLSPSLTGSVDLKSLTALISSQINTQFQKLKSSTSTPSSVPSKKRKSFKSSNHPPPAEPATAEEKSQNCTVCGRKGHPARNCWGTNKKKAAKVARILDDIPVHAFSAKTLRADALPFKPGCVRLFADSGASAHMVTQSEQRLLTNLVPSSLRIGTAGSVIVASGSGSLGSMNDVLLVPDLTHNLFSISHACRGGYVAVFDDHGLKLMSRECVQLTGTPVLTGLLSRDGMYTVDVPIKPINCALVASVQPTNSFTMWHRRLGHISFGVMRSMMNNNVLTHFKFTKLHMKQHKCGGICSGCAFGSMPLAPVRRLPKSTTTSSTPSVPSPSVPCRLVVVDILTSPVVSIAGNKYALVIMDADTRYLWTYLQKSKDGPETMHNMRSWISE